MSEYCNLTKALEEQRDAIREWLDITAAQTSIEQRHLVECTPERDYWHHGYQAALDDVLRQIIANQTADCSAGKPN